METSLKLPHQGLSQREHQGTHLYQLPHLLESKLQQREGRQLL